MEQDDEYIHGFNNGYFLAKFEPELITKLIQHLMPVSSYLDGLFSGKEEFDLEQIRKQENELDHLRDRFEERDNNLKL